LFHSVPLRDRSGKVLKWYGKSTDITELKQAEEERERLRQLESEIAHINRVSMMGELAASLAHEIKQPIASAVINAYSCQRYLEGEAPRVEKASKATAAMVANVTRAADIIDRVRSLYRRDTPEREQVDLNEIVREMIALLRHAANRNSVAVRVTLEPALPTVLADRIQLQQVLMNLMLNGIEAMDDRGGELTVASARTTVSCVCR
jgi:C4-dicarboxylate-specific signal transduction histidine kinase